MAKNTYDIDKYSELQELLEKVGELNTNVAELSNTNVKSLYAENPKKYQRLWTAFSGAHKVVSEEISSIANDYDRMQKYNKAKSNHDFFEKQLEGIRKQREMINQI